MKTLARQFAETRPAEVAELLSREPLEEIVLFLGELGASTAAAVAARLTSVRLHELMARLPASRLSELLVAAPAGDLVSMTSHLERERHEEILLATPEGETNRLEKIFNFTTQTVATLAIPEFIRVDEQTTTADACDMIESLGSSKENLILIVDEHLVYQGMVSAIALLQARRQDIPVRQLMQSIEPLPSQMPLDSATTVPQWSGHPVLPVVNSDGQIMGVVSNARIHEYRAGTAAPASSMEDVIQFAALSYLDLCSDLIDIGIGRENA